MHYAMKAAITIYNSCCKTMCVLADVKLIVGSYFVYLRACCPVYYQSILVNGTKFLTVLH